MSARWRRRPSFVMQGRTFFVMAYTFQSMLCIKWSSASFKYVFSTAVLRRKKGGGRERGEDMKRRWRHQNKKINNLPTARDIKEAPGTAARGPMNLMAIQRAAAVKEWNVCGRKELIPLAFRVLTCSLWGGAEGEPS